MDFIIIFGAGIVIVMLLVLWKYYDNEYKDKFPGL